MISNWRNLWSGECNLSEQMKLTEESVHNVRKACKESITNIVELPNHNNKNAVTRNQNENTPNIEPWKGSSLYKSGEHLCHKAEFIKDTNSPVKQILKQMGDMQKKLARHQCHFESMVQEELCQDGAIQKVMEANYPAMIEEKGILQKKQKQLTFIQNRYNVAKKRREDNTYATNVEALKAKEIKLRDDMDALQKEVESIEDKLATTLYTLHANETEYASNLSQYVLHFLGFLNSSYTEVNSILPDIKKITDATNSRKVFGVNLESHVKAKKGQIATPLEVCADGLMDHLKLEGLFRIGPDVKKLKRFKASIDAGKTERDQVDDPHIFASTMKAYLRELPEPLLGSKKINDWKFAAGMDNTKRQREKIKEIIADLPLANQNNISFLFNFLARVAKEKDSNKMTVDNLVIVLGPNLLWGSSTGGQEVLVSIKPVIKMLIEEAGYFFPKEYFTDELFKRESEIHTAQDNTKRQSCGPVLIREASTSDTKRRSGKKKNRHGISSPGVIERRYSSPVVIERRSTEKPDDIKSQVEKRQNRKLRAHGVSGDNFLVELQNKKKLNPGYGVTIPQEISQTDKREGFKMPKIRTKKNKKYQDRPKSDQNFDNSSERQKNNTLKRSSSPGILERTLYTLKGEKSSLNSNNIISQSSPFKEINTYGIEKLLSPNKINNKKELEVNQVLNDQKEKINKTGTETESKGKEGTSDKIGTEKESYPEGENQQLDSGVQNDEKVILRKENSMGNDEAREKRKISYLNCRTPISESTHLVSTANNGKDSNSAAGVEEQKLCTVRESRESNNRRSIE